MQQKQQFIDGDAGPLQVIIQPPLVAISPNIVFVMCHPHPQFEGSMQNKVVTTTTKAMQTLGITTVRFNFRGVGESAGHYAEGVGEQADLQAVLNYVAATYPGHALWLGGFSFGAYIAYCAASRHPGVQQLLSIAPGVVHFNFLAQPAPTMPWTIIQGDADEVVPPEKVYAMLAQVPSSYHLIKLAGVGHFFHQRLITLKKELCQHYTPRIHT